MDPDGLPAAGAGGETATFTATDAGTYFVVVDAWSVGVEGAFSLSVTVD